MTSTIKTVINLQYKNFIRSSILKASLQKPYSIQILIKLCPLSNITVPRPKCKEILKVLAKFGPID